MLILNALKKVVSSGKEDIEKVVNSFSEEDKAKAKAFAQEMLKVLATAAVNSAAQKVSEKI